MFSSHADPNRQTSFPELVGRSTQEAAAFISARGLTPVIMKPNQPATMDYRSNRVRIIADPSGAVVAQAPNIGHKPSSYLCVLSETTIMYYNYQQHQNQRQSFPELVGQEPYSSANFIAAHGLTPVLMTPFDPMTNDYRMDRVRVIVCPRRNVVMQVPVVG